MILREKLYRNFHNEWVKKDLEEMTYVDNFGGNDHGVAFLRQANGSACRFHMKYARGVVARGDIWGKLAEFQIDRVSAQRGILGRKLAEGDIPNALRTEIRNELEGIRERWETPRSEEADQERRPFLSSYEWEGVEKGIKEGIPRLMRNEWLKRPQKSNGYGWEV